MPGTIDKTLSFLSKIGWIEQSSKDELIVYVGKRILDLRKHLINAHATILAQQEMKTEKKKLKRQARNIQKSEGQKRIDDF